MTEVVHDNDTIPDGRADNEQYHSDDDFEVLPPVMWHGFGSISRVQDCELKSHICFQI